MKAYEEPIMEVCMLIAKDIVTLSGYPSGGAGSDEFDNIFGNGGGNSGW